jgi:hypothetical protein
MMVRLLAVSFVALFFVSPLRADDFRVTVVAILGSDRHSEIDPKLKNIADQLKKRDPSLTGWKIDRTTVKTLKLNEKEKFPLVGDVNADVAVLGAQDADKKIRLNIKAPHAGEVTGGITAEKFFPVWTRYQTDKDKQRLVFAVMVKQVPSKDKDDKDKGKDKDKDKDKAPPPANN